MARLTWGNTERQQDVDLVTIGKGFYPGEVFHVWHNPDEAVQPDLGAGTRLRLIFFETGSGLVEVGDRQSVLMAPALLCLNETERPRLTRSYNVRAQGLYFHPNLINSSLDFDNVRSRVMPAGWRDSDWQDHHLVSAFVERGSRTPLLITLGPSTSAQVSRLLASIQQELTNQSDAYWPCRSRSFFLELLFLVDRLSRRPETEMAELSLDSIGSLGQLGTGRLDDASSDHIEDVIAYLHAHYSEKISLEQLCREFHSNRTTLSERFRRATGQSIMTYLLNLRIRVAALMLRDTRLPVSEVAQRTGFIDMTHFGRAFRKGTGDVPSEFRKRYCWMAEQVGQ